MSAQQVTRKTPATIEAFQLTTETRADNSNWPDWLDAALLKNPTEVGSISQEVTEAGDGPLQILTSDGPVVWDIGDYMLRGEQGVLYPCKPDDFAANYDAVDGG